MMKDEDTKAAVKVFRDLMDQIERGEVEIDEFVHELGVKVTELPGKTFDRKEQSGDEIWTLKVYRKGRPRATHISTNAPGIGTWRNER